MALCALAIVLTASAPAALAARQASMVIDVNSGRVLHADKADAPRYPASLTKLMTIYMIFDEVRAGRLGFDSRITFSARATNIQPSKLGLKKGDSITVLDAVKTLITKSANDVAYAVAEHIAGSRAAFAGRMTRRARELGMSNTRFANASGLPNRTQVTTARDILTLALHLIDDYPQHYHLFSLRSFTYRGRTYRSHNALLGNYRGTDGLKTGYTRASGFNLVTSARRKGRHLIGAVFGAGTAGARNRKMRALLSAAFKQAAATKTRKPAPATARAPADPPVKIARVRPVPLAGQAGPAGPAPPVGAPVEAGSTAAETLRGGDWPAPLGARRTTFATRAALAAGPQPRLAGFARRPSTLDAQAARLAGGARRYAAPVQAIAGFEAASSAAAAAPTGPALADTAGRSLPPAYGLRGPLPRRGDYQVQVGAYGSVTEAQNQINDVRVRAGTLLSGYATVTMPIDKAGKRYFRARFTGFDSRNATATCLELRRLQVDCYVARAN